VLKHRKLEVVVDEVKDQTALKISKGILKNLRLLK